MIVDPELMSGFSGSQWQHCAMEVINGNAVQSLAFGNEQVEQQRYANPSAHML